MKEKQKKSGISLIVLVITIIVIVILAVAVILSIANNNPIENANKAKFQNDLKSIQEDLELTKASNYAKSYGESYGQISFSDLTGSDKNENKFIVSNGELMYAKNKLSDEEKEWCNELGIKKGGTLLESSISGITISNSGTLSTDWHDGDFGANVPEGITSIIIPSNINKIEGYAFGYYTSLKDIYLPDSIEHIGSGAFISCTNLENINLPNSINYIGDNAFASCTSLKSIKLPNSLKSISTGVFSFCNFESVELPESLEIIDYYAFYSCKNLKEIEIPNSVTNISSDAFVECNLTLIISKKHAQELFRRYYTVLLKM